MRKNVLLIVRILIAVAGVSYVLFSLTYTDKVQVPAGAQLPDGSVMQKPADWPIIEGDATAFNSGSKIVIKTAHGTMTVPVEPRGIGDEMFQLKTGIVTMLGDARIIFLLLGVLAVAPIYPIQGLRWRGLLQARGLNVTFAKAFRLVMVGCFFNYCMPVGTTGGDVAKAYYAAKGSGRRADAVMSVIFDRFVGLLGLLVLASVTGSFMLHNPVARSVTKSIWLIGLIVIVGAIVYFTPAVRKILGIDWIIHRMPGKAFAVSIDDATVAYRHHKPAIAAGVGLSILVHSCIVTSTILAGYALNIEHQPQTMGVLIAIVPVIFLVGAIPISYQGLGLMEGIGMPLLVASGLCTANQLIGMLMIVRLSMVFYSLLGSFFLLRGDIHFHPQQDEAAVNESTGLESPA